MYVGRTLATEVGRDARRRSTAPVGSSRSPATAPVAWDDAFDAAVLAVSAQLLGAGERVLADSVAYVKQRKQFGREIGSYQAIKHALADVRIALDFARPLVFAAALGEVSPSAAKVAACRRGVPRRRAPGCRCTARSATPPELDLSIWITKIRALVTAWGTPSVHRERLLSLADWSALMEFAFSEEQQELAATVRSLLSKRADSAAVRAAMASETGYDESLWQTLCEQIGVAALAIPEEYDGAGFSLLESMIALEEVGRSLAPSPLLSSLVTAEALLAGADRRGEEAAAAADRGRRGGGVRRPGRAALFARPGHRCSSAATDDGLVELDPASSDPEWLPSMDQTIRLGVTRRERRDPDRRRLLRLATGRSWSARSASRRSRPGLAARALEMTVAYSKERVQFGRPIGSFQALKHRMADLLVLVEMSRSASWAASYAVSTDAPNAERLAHVAKSYCSDALNKIAAETVQLHGGIAITWEHDAQLVFKRAHALSQLYGAPHTHRALIEL